MAAGVPLSMVPVLKYERTSRDSQRELFGAATAQEALRSASQYNICYLYLGRPDSGGDPSLKRCWPRPRLCSRGVFSPDVVIHRVGHAVMLETRE